MHNMKLFDLHCDTATRLLAENQGLYDNGFHVSLKKSAYLSRYAQVMAIWTDKRLTDSEGYERFFEVIKNLENEAHINKNSVKIIKNAYELNDSITLGITPLIVSVEDARILENDIERLTVLYQSGVRALTLNWYGTTCIGGAHDNDIGLTDFGKQVVEECFRLGIVPDVSHCSFKGTSDALEIAQVHSKPLIASHSDSYSVNPHTRNLQDNDFITISKLGGLVGINLCPSHLNLNGSAKLCDIIRHIEHYMSLGGENTVAMGCDLDGTNLPNGFQGIQDIYKIENELQKLNYSNDLTDKIFYKNAFNFFTNNI